MRSRLQELKDEQSETLYDRSVSDQEEALDQMLENSKEQTEDYTVESFSYIHEITALFVFFGAVFLSYGAEYRPCSKQNNYYGAGNVDPTAEGAFYLEILPKVVHIAACFA